MPPVLGTPLLTLHARTDGREEQGFLVGSRTLPSESEGQSSIYQILPNRQPNPLLSPSLSWLGKTARPTPIISFLPPLLLLPASSSLSLSSSFLTPSFSLLLPTPSQVVILLPSTFFLSSFLPLLHANGGPQNNETAGVTCAVMLVNRGPISLARPPRSSPRTGGGIVPSYAQQHREQEKSCC